jgi:hypothetical protein
MMKIDYEKSKIKHPKRKHLYHDIDDEELELERY